MAKCEHDLIELSRGAVGNKGYSPTLLKCKKCKQLFQVRLNRDKNYIIPIEIEDKKDGRRK